MDNSTFQSLIAMLDDLSTEQKNFLISALNEENACEKVIAIIETKFSEGIKCPHCGHLFAHKWGKQSGLQRYRCTLCKKSFNALTGTPLAHLRKKEHWLQMASALQEGLTVKKTAAKCDVHVTTAFRWRHRFLSATKQDPPDRLDGITEADETYFLESFKGSRKLPRKPRRRGGQTSSVGLSSEQIPVLIARDRTGRIVQGILSDKSSKAICAVLDNKIDKDNVLCIDGGNALFGYANARHIPYKIMPPGRYVHEKDPIFHIQNVNAYHSRLKSWIRKFNGVATKYLSNYLGWRKMYEQPHTILTPTVFIQSSVSLYNT